MSIRIGIIGSGFGAQVVAPVFAATPGCEVVEVVSARNTAGAAMLCDRDDIDLISVHSPPLLHVMHVRRALAAGHAVLCDKPFGRNAMEAETLMAAAEAAECLHLINFEFRFDPVRMQLRNLIAKGAIGIPEHATWTHWSSGSRVPLRKHGWLFERASGGGWIGAWGSHAVDALRWFFGEIVDVKGAGRTIIKQRPDETGALITGDAEDSFWADLTFATGMSATIDSSFAATATVAPRLNIFGDAGVIELSARGLIVVRGPNGEREEFVPCETSGDPPLEPMRAWALVVRDAVEAGIAPPEAPTFADGLACARVLDVVRAGTLGLAGGVPSSTMG